MSGVAAHENEEASQARGPRALEQREAARRVVGHESRRARPERGRHGPLATSLDLEQREGDPLALLRQRARRRRQPLTLGESAVERAQPLLEQPHLLPERRPLGPDPLVEDAAGPLQFVAQVAQPRLGRLAAHRDALCGAAQPVERLQRLFAPARSVRELLLGAPALGE